MGENRSLEEFDGGNERANAGDSVDSDDSEATTPATPTYRFHPDGAACENCERSVQRRWHDDGRFVCADCKSW